MGKYCDEKVIFADEKTMIDSRTGEVIKTEQHIVKTVPKTPDFIMLFTENVGALMELTSKENSVLSVILQKYVMRGNGIIINSQVKKSIIKECGIKESSLRTILYNLKKKKIFVEDPDTGMSYLNPYIFGKGSWNEVRKLRQEIVFEWDFEKNEMTKTIGVSGIYEEFGQLKPDMVVEAKEEQKGKRISREITVDEDAIRGERCEKPSQARSLFDDGTFERRESRAGESIGKTVDTVNSRPPSISREIETITEESDNEMEMKRIELEILKEKNREMELQIKLAELELKKKQ